MNITKIVGLSIRFWVAVLGLMALVVFGSRHWLDLNNWVNLISRLAEVIWRACSELQAHYPALLVSVNPLPVVAWFCVGLLFSLLGIAKFRNRALSVSYSSAKTAKAS